MDIALSACCVPEGVHRESRRPEALRDARYKAQFDWNTLFYDVYRSGDRIVFQGPPFENLLPLLRQSACFYAWFSGLFPRARHIGHAKRGEIWVKDSTDAILLDGPLGEHFLCVRPDENQRFAGRRVLHTLSKDNDIAWIVDWARFYAVNHGADAILLYDNASTAYDLAELRARLTGAFPDFAIAVVGWPFKYGPQGGLAGAVNGIEAPWDSDFCQTGSLQHARFRFLQSARSVLNVDIDELVLSSRGRSIFEATEKSWSGFVKFPGTWISTATAHAVARDAARHGDFRLRDREETETCPPKWCIRPGAARRSDSWSVHNLFGARKNRRVSDEFLYRHVKGISNNWKYDRWDAVPYSPDRFIEDEALAAALDHAGLEPQLAI